MITARDEAIHAHANQLYGDKPYVYHLDKVYQVLEDFGYDSDDYYNAAYLHDIVEDTDWTLVQVHLLYGAQVAQLVNAVTGEGTNRRERQNNIMSKLRAFPEACVLKLADRIANVEEGGKLDMYRKEGAMFEHVVRRHVPSEMWTRYERALNGTVR